MALAGSGIGRCGTLSCACRICAGYVQDMYAGQPDQSVWFIFSVENFGFIAKINLGEIL